MGSPGRTQFGMTNLWLLDFPRGGTALLMNNEDHNIPLSKMAGYFGGQCLRRFVSGAQSTERVLSHNLKGY